MSRHARRMAFVGTLGLSLGLLSGTGNPLSAQLSPADEAKLTEALERIMVETWPWPSGQEADAILLDPSYDAGDWRDFFSGFFSSHLYQYNLNDFTAIRVFWNYPDGAQQRLQEGMIDPMCTLMRRMLEDNRSDLGPAMHADQDLRESLFLAQHFIRTYGERGWNPLARETVFDWYLQLVTDYSEFFSKASTIDINSQRYVGLLRAQVMLILAEMSRLDTADESAVSSALALTGSYARIWDDLSVLLIDNNGSTENQLDQFYLILSQIPAALLRPTLRVVTMFDFLRAYDENPPSWSASLAVNTFNFPLDWSENSFQSDMEPREVSIFSVALVHEANHRVDADYINEDPILRDRMQTLIQAAGDPWQNYLRGWQDGFFTNAPQEFFAAIANAWFTDSEHTLRVGRLRFDTGIPHPLDQAIFFANVYSLWSDSTHLYRMGVGPGLERSAARLERNAAGHITRIEVGDSTYVFEVDPSGNVLSYRFGVCIDGLGLWGDADGNGSVTEIDATAVARLLTGLSVSDPERVHAVGDVNADGVVDVIDVQQIARHAAGLSTESRTGSCID
jgi:hypothetical protein